MTPVLANPSLWPQSFPLMRAGGLFILIMGVATLLGALIHSQRRVLLTAGAVSATLAIILFAARLSAPYGVPTRLQVGFLGGAIVAEAILIRLAVARYRASGQRSLLLAILFVVGLHFLPMAVAFGPGCAVLGLALCLCAGSGLWLMPRLPLKGLWAADGLIKIAFGAVMLLLR